LCLLDASFRHQDYKFIPAVAGDNVRLPAFLFEQTSYARKNEVALEMAE